MTAPAVASLALVIGKIKVVGVLARDAIAPVRLIVIPADKIYGIAEIIAVGAIVARAALIGFPGGFQGLAITVGIGRARPGDKAEDFTPGGAGRRP